VYYDNVDNAKEILVNTIKSNSKWYKSAIIDLVIARQDEKKILYRGKIDFCYSKDDQPNEVTYDYGTAILARRILSIKEFLNLLQNWEEVVTVKDLKAIEIGEDFGGTIYRTPSRFHYRDIIHDWPVQDFFTKGMHNISINIVNDYLIKPGCPTYPTFTDATRSFLKLDRQYFNNNPYGFQILVPDYRARLKLLEISEKNISVQVEVKESDYSDLLLKVNAKNKTEEFLPKDFEITSDRIEFELPFIPNALSLFLVSKNDGKVIDLKRYGDYDSESYEGIVIKTSKDVMESLIAQGESKNVEFKRDFDKDEFLETVVAFANSGTGKIILGVDDKGNVLGIYEEFSNLEKRIRGTISGRCEPQIDVNVEDLEIDGKPVVVVSVKEGKDKPFLVRTKAAYYRSGDTDLAMNRIELDKIYANKSQNSRRDQLEI